MRLYGWERPTLTVGRLQELDGRDVNDRLLDRDRCREQGIDVVRRPTGGRAILHHPGDLTFSVVAALDDPHMGRDVMASYRSVNDALVRGLRGLGVRAAVREQPPMWPGSGVGFACFEQAYRHEVYWAGRKLVAGAQRRREGAVLQQGTVPGRETGDGVAALLRLDPARRSVLRRDLADRTGTLERALDRLPEFEEAAEAFAGGFREAWGVEFERGPLAPGEERRAREIAAVAPVTA